MPIIPCPSCGTKLKVPESAAGKKVACPSCKQVVTVPAMPPGPAASGPSPPPAPPGAASTSRPARPPIDEVTEEIGNREQKVPPAADLGDEDRPRRQRDDDLDELDGGEPRRRPAKKSGNP